MRTLPLHKAFMLLEPGPVTLVTAHDGARLYVLHDLAELDLDPKAAGIGVVVSGHSHQPRIAEDDGVLYVNPGSAGPRRFRLPIAMAECTSREWRQRLASSKFAFPKQNSAARDFHSGSQEALPSNCE